MQNIDFPIRGEFVTLDALLKATGLSSSGGSAKFMITEGKVQVDGREELRKTAKLRPGQVVSVHGARVRILEPLTEAEQAAAAALRAEEVAPAVEAASGEPETGTDVAAAKPREPRRKRDTLEIFKR
ncbi:MAG: RNA-binding protein [Rhizobacter sp.]|nr:RNA-binding protein [Rhizobacter sp.]